MKDRFFLDTNLFVYSFHHGAPAKEKCARDPIANAVTRRKGIVTLPSRPGILERRAQAV
jgi:hypothetical protein